MFEQFLMLIIFEGIQNFLQDFMPSGDEVLNVSGGDRKQSISFPSLMFGFKDPAHYQSLHFHLANIQVHLVHMNHHLTVMRNY